MTMSLNKSLHMDPHVSCLVSPVTEYLATQGSSSFHEHYWPGMYTASLLISLKQGTRSLEDFIQEYLDVVNSSDFPDDVLIDFFCDSINQPLKSRLICEGPRSSLSQFLDYALMTVGSAFTVGVAEERDTALIRDMTAALEHAHEMAATTEPDRKMADTTAPRQVTADLHEPSQVTAVVHEPSQVTADLHEPSQVTADLHKPSQVTADHHEPSHVSADRHEPSQVTVDLPESSQVTVDHPESRHVSADLPESRHVSADLPESRHVSADLPGSRHVSADLPGSHHVPAGHPESRHVPAGHPESRHITPRYSRSVLRFLSLVFLRSTSLLNYRLFGASGSRSLGGGSVTNPVRGLPSTCHQRSPSHHIDSHTTQTGSLHLALQFPSSTALTTHTADCTDHTQLIPICTPYLSHGLSLFHGRVLYAYIATLADSYPTEPL